MQKKNHFIVLVFGITVSFCLFPSIGFSSDLEKNTQLYNNCIIKEISKCQSKSKMITSKSDNLRQYALLESKKAAFYMNAKDMLINEMMEGEVDPKNYQVEYYLNKRYNEFKKYFVLYK